MKTWWREGTDTWSHLCELVEDRDMEAYLWGEPSGDCILEQLWAEREGLA